MKKCKSQSGMTLVETMIALGVLLVVAATVMGLGALALATTENQGHLAARTAEYGQDKMEQLLALAFCNSDTDTTIFPAGITGGTGLAGCDLTTTPPTPSTGGSLSISAPVTGYVDYLDSSGNLVTAGANWQYIRVWQISIPPGTTLVKQVAVKTQVRSGVGQNALLPQATVVAWKSYPF